MSKAKPVLPVQIRSEKQLKDAQSLLENRNFEQEIERWLKGNLPQTWNDCHILLQELITEDNINSDWGALLNQLNPSLQLDLVYRLAIYNRWPDQRDWLNLFRPSRFEFGRSWGYWVILGVALVASLGAVDQLGWSIEYHPDQAWNGLLLVAIVVEIFFWVALWRGLENRLEPTTFAQLGIWGVATFFRETRCLLTNCPLWEGVKLIDTFVVGALALVVAGALALVVTGAWTEAETVAVAEAGAWTEAGAVAGVWGLLSSCGLSVLYKAYESQGKKFSSIPFWQKLLALFAFPWFCWFPITAIFSLLGLHNVLQAMNVARLGNPWVLAITIWLSLFGGCCVLWVDGNRRERAARNPLQGILDDYYPQYKQRVR